MRKNLKVILYDPSGHGGICHYTYQLAENMTRAGVDVTVFTTDDYELQHLARNFKLHPLFKKSWIKGWSQWIKARLGSKASNRKGNRNQQDHRGQVDNLSGKWDSVLKSLQRLRLKITLRKAVLRVLLDRPHLVHFQWPVNLREDYYFIKTLKFFGFKIVYTAHDLLPQVSQSVGDREAFEKIYRSVDGLIVHAEINKNEMIRVFNIRPDKIAVIPHGSYDLFQKHGAISKDVARQELGISQTKKVILFFGLIKKYKGLEYLVDAFEAVQRDVNDSMLLVVGKIYDGVAEEFKYYSDLISQLRGCQNVMCVPEYVPVEKIATYFSAADIVVLPYTRIYQSGVLLSAFAAGRPVIVTDTGGMSEVVEEGKSGFVVPPKDAKALSQAIITALTQPGRVEEMGKYAKHLAETTYSWESIASQTLDLYRRLITKPEPVLRDNLSKDVILK